MLTGLRLKRAAAQSGVNTLRTDFIMFSYWAP
jgi:hypothetical protein